jgi:hypothetical protein
MRCHIQRPQTTSRHGIITASKWRSRSSRIPAVELASIAHFERRGRSNQPVDQNCQTPAQPSNIQRRRGATPLNQCQVAHAGTVQRPCKKTHLPTNSSLQPKSKSISQREEDDESGKRRDRGLTMKFQQSTAKPTDENILHELNLTAKLLPIRVKSALKPRTLERNRTKEMRIIHRRGRHDHEPIFVVFLPG